MKKQPATVAMHPKPLTRYSQKYWNDLHASMRDNQNLIDKLQDHGYPGSLNADLSAPLCNLYMRGLEGARGEDQSHDPDARLLEEQFYTGVTQLIGNGVRAPEIKETLLADTRLETLRTDMQNNPQGLHEHLASWVHTLQKKTSYGQGLVTACQRECATAIRHDRMFHTVDALQASYDAFQAKRERFEGPLIVIRIKIE